MAISCPARTIISAEVLIHPKATLAIRPPERLFFPSISFSFGEWFFTKTDFRVLGHITQEASLVKIDSDTGITVAARRDYKLGLIQVLVSKADARDLAPCTIVRFVICRVALLERVTGVHSPSYATVSLSYNFVAM